MCWPSSGYEIACLVRLLIVLMQVDCLDSVRSDRLILISTEDPHFIRQTCAIFTIRVKYMVTRDTLMPRSISEDLYAHWDIDKYYKHDGALLSVNCFRKALLITLNIPCYTVRI